MNDYLGTISWSEMMSSDSIQENWDIFIHLLNDAISLPLYWSQTNLMLGGQKVYQEQLVLSMLFSQDTESLRHTHTHRLCKLHSQKEQS